MAEDTNLTNAIDRHDSATTALLIAAGYTVLRFNEIEVFFEPDRVVAALRSAFWQHNVG